MARQIKAWQRVSGVAGTAAGLAGAGMALGNLDCVVGHVACLLASTAGAGLAALPSIILTAWQELPLCGLVHESIIGHTFRVLVSSWPAILAIAGS